MIDRILCKNFVWNLLEVVYVPVNLLSLGAGQGHFYSDFISLWLLHHCFVLKAYKKKTLIKISKLVEEYWTFSHSGFWKRLWFLTYFNYISFMFYYKEWQNDKISSFINCILSIASNFYGLYFNWGFMKER